MPSADVVIYTRVSHDKFGRKESVAQQEADLRSLADEEGWRVVGVFTDNDRSASEFARKDRPGLDDLERYLRSNHVDVLALWEASRLARSMRAAIYFRDLCRERGIKIFYGEKMYDMANADERKHFTDDMADAEHESAKASKRVRRSVRSRASRGLPHGKQVFGYTRVYDDATRELVEIVENSEQATLLRAMADRVLNGESCYCIAVDLNARSVPAPRGEVWHATNVARLLKNPAYVGRRVHQGNVLGVGAWPPIFADETWDRLQAVLGDPARLTRHEGGVRHLLSGIMTCGVCGGRIAVIKQRGGYLAYQCIGNIDLSRPRFCTARKAEDVDAWVQMVVVEKLKRPDALAVFARDEDEDGVALINEEVAVLRARLEGFYDSATRPGGITAGALARIEGSLLAEIDKLESRRRELMVPSLLRGLDVSSVGDQWEGWPLLTKRAILREFFEIKLHRAGRGARTFDPKTVEIGLRFERSRPAD